MDAMQTISAAVHGAARGFLELERALETHELSIRQLPPGAVQDEFARFKVSLTASRC